MKEQNLITRLENSLAHWRDEERMALELIKTAGELRFEKGVELVLFRSDIYDSRPSEVLNTLRFSLNYADEVVSIEDALNMARAIAEMSDLIPAKIDVGRLAMEWVTTDEKYVDTKEFIHYKLRDFNKSDIDPQDPCDVVLYGFGRIGRLIARRILSTTGRGDQLRLRAIVIRPKMKDIAQEMEKRAALLMDDSIHGEFQGRVELDIEDKTLVINGNRVKMIFAGHPSEIDYREYGINDALVIDNTGVWRDREGLSQHLRPGVKNVLLTAPGKGDVPNVVYGVNQGDFDYGTERVLSAASCTTNAIVPIIRVIDDKFGIEKGHIETIHAYTSDQNLLDNFHKKPRRGRAAAINMVLTTTGAASAVAKVIPHMSGRLTGNAVRVPTPDVSLAIMALNLTKPTSVDELNDAIKNASLNGDLVEQIFYSTSTEFSSSHAIGSTSTSICDAPSTIVSEDGKTAMIYAWYDNEYGYCCQVVRLAKYVANVRRKTYY
jgi:glyceraldehyde 3-phosphate dehydrogenase